MHVPGSGIWGRFLEEVVPCIIQASGGGICRGSAWEEDGGHGGVWDVEMEWLSDLIVSELLEDLLKQAALPSPASASSPPAFVLLPMSPCLPAFHTEHLWGCPPREVVQGAPVLCHPGAEQG